MAKSAKQSSRKQASAKETAERDVQRRIRSKASQKVAWSFPLTRKNFIYAAIGLGVIILGFALMATGITEQPAVTDGKWNNVFAVSIAPLLLVIGYCIIIPFAIIKFFGGEKDQGTES